MSETREDWLAAASVDPAIWELRPDYRVTLIAVDGLRADHGPEVAAETDALVAEAERIAAARIETTPIGEWPHIAAWRAAYSAFGTKPSRNRNSLEALSRRAGAGLPRVNALTDRYNAISVIHGVPLGGEDLDRYVGSPRLWRASGEEQFDTVADGESVIEHPEPGEVVWGDDTGVTCRRWNWRQCRRTALRSETASAVFILDALDPFTDEALADAAEALVDVLRPLSQDLVVSRRTLRAPE